MIAFAALVNALKSLTRLTSRGTGSDFKLASRVYGTLVERQALHRMSRLPPHLLRDMGFDPEDVAAAMRGDVGVSEPFRRREIEKSEAGASYMRVPSVGRTKARPSADAASCPECEAAGVSCC